MYWEVSGNPLGQPALFLHGGPGAGCSADDRRWFDPAHYRIVLLDQRGCGRSWPLGGREGNTTHGMVSDIEQLRLHLGVERWLLLGGSWGATLALAYAQRHPQRVSAMVLRGVFLGTAAEREWLYGRQGAGAAAPQAYAAFAGAGTLVVQLLRSYEARLQSLDGDALAAARAWLRWEQELMHLEEGSKESVREPLGTCGQVVAHARISVQHALAGYFLQEGELLTGAPSLRAVPGVILQGTADLVTPPAAARALHAVWSGSVLAEVSGAGHSSRDPAMARELVAATDAFRA
jgi:proline iminopeptidase